MAKKDAEITLRVFIVEKDGKQTLSTVVDVKGIDRDVMDVAELAQNSGLIGEYGVEHVLLHILNKPGGIDDKGRFH